MRKLSFRKKFLDQPVECPRCWVKADRVVRKGIEIDICPKCKGIWVDTKELKKLINNPELHKHLTKYVGIESKSSLVCPRCGGLMNLEYAENVEVDVCLSCKGIWLDKGEFEELKGKENKRFETFDIDKEVKLKKVERIQKKSIMDKLVELVYYK